MTAAELVVRSPSEADVEAFLAAVARSTELHDPWVQPPADGGAFRAYVERTRSASQRGYFGWVGDDLVGVANLNEIIRGAFQNAFLGYYGFTPMAGRGLMRQLLARVLDDAFGAVGLHRVEANVQPGNDRSRALVASLGFRLEGFSPAYLRIAGDWRDHERWALLADEWRGG